MGQAERATGQHLLPLPLGTLTLGTLFLFRILHADECLPLALPSSPAPHRVPSSAHVPSVVNGISEGRGQACTCSRRLRYAFGLLSCFSPFTKGVASAVWWELAVLSSSSCVCSTGLEHHAGQGVGTPGICSVQAPAGLSRTFQRPQRRAGLWSLPAFLASPPQLCELEPLFLHL